MYTLTDGTRPRCASTQDSLNNIDYGPAKATTIRRVLIFNWFQVNSMLAFKLQVRRLVIPLLLPGPRNVTTTRGNLGPLCVLTM